MNKQQTVFVSNRLAVRVDRDAEHPESLRYSRSVGGLATGLSSVAGDGDDTLWVGWSGIPGDTLSDAERADLTRTLRADHHAVPVDISSDELDLFYSGFCNDTIWPLFHYFPTYTEYHHEWWHSYQEINERFFDVLRGVLEEDATVWVHDYHLFLLPRLIKRAFPSVKVGFFLHIPFPSYELFRLLPWREEVLEGMLGSDLIGFHTYDYARHFLSSVRRLCGYDHAMGVIQTPRRAVKVDVFPMGIDWARYADAGTLPEVQRVMETVSDRYRRQKLVLSVDRLDYSKGIPTRIRAFGRMLEMHPELSGTVTLLIIVSPSRETVPRYAELKREVEELVSSINGRHSNLDWVPIYYQYRTASFEELSGLYRRADALLVTPLRDGMNLIAKEYLAARTDNRGVLVLSETAGAARELSEAIHVNASDIDGIADAIREAILQSEEEQEASISVMRRRLERLTVQYWAHSFLEKLDAMTALQESYRATPITRDVERTIGDQWSSARSRLLILDYDGTLMRFFKRPEHARPDEELELLLRRLAAIEGVHVVISSGRDRTNLEGWLGDLPVSLGAGHGAWLREAGSSWEAAPDGVAGWKELIEPIIQTTVDHTPGSTLERKDFSLAWHYRNSEPELAAVRLAELRETLIGLTSNLELSVLDGNRVIEVKPTHIHKGQVVRRFLERGEWDLVVAIGDDATDEYMFQALDESAVTIKVGGGATAAHYSIDGVAEVRALLADLSQRSSPD